MLQWFGNLVIGLPVGLPRRGEKEREKAEGGIGFEGWGWLGGQLEPLVIEGSDGKTSPPNSYLEPANHQSTGGNDKQITR